MDPAVRPAPPARPRRFRRLLVRLLTVFTLVLAGYHGWVLWQVWRLREHNPYTTAFMQNGLERLQSSNPTAYLQHRWVPYEQIAEHLKHAGNGAEAAAQHYYGKAAADLEPEEAARLAAMIPSPRLYTRNPSTPYLEQRTEILLGQMEYVRVP